MDMSDEPASGGIPYAIGQSSVVRIPVPGTQGLAIELNARGWVPRGGSTSVLFFQDLTGKRHLRLDFGYNVATKTIDYHWNQSKTFQQFGIADHTPAGSSGQKAYKAAKFFRHAGRVLWLAGAALDIASVVRASQPMRRATEVVSGWAGAWVGCKAVGAGGAAVGTLASPLGSAIGGIGGCIIGGAAGYYAASTAAGQVYAWAEGTTFSRLPEAAAP